jgi:hypothetical protein
VNVRKTGRIKSRICSATVTPRGNTTYKLSRLPGVFQLRGLLLLGLLLEVCEDGFGGLAVGEGVGVYAEGRGFPIEGFALVVELLQGPPGVGGLKERALAVFDPLVELLGAGVEPDHGADLRKKSAVFLGRNHPAAGGNDETDASDQALQDLGFEGAKIRLAMPLEYGGDRLTCFPGHEGVGIDQGEAGEG